MPFYNRLGQIPPKRHTQFRQPDGSLYYEELVSSYGFSGIYSNLYHSFPPTRVISMGAVTPLNYHFDKGYGLKQTHIKTSILEPTGPDYISAKMPMLGNQDVILYMLLSDNLSMPYYFKNAEADEVLFIHEGNGVLESQMGSFRYRPGDYVVIPRTVIYRIKPDQGRSRFMITESFSPVETVSRYRNDMGQLLEHSPYCERDIRTPDAIVLELEKGSYTVRIKKDNAIHDYGYEHSPFDVVGWDGCLYPYALSIHDFEPITGRIHQPPPVHQTFQGRNFVICSFVPRLFDYHPLSIPAPYNHSNIDSDEVLYYVEGNFMSRRGIDVGSFTLHPGGLPHGPHPGTVEASIGAKETLELAVMVDTFKPLYPSVQSEKYLDSNYPFSWIS
ncbi:MAG TPA: homogentisate 1,2-dioxygenase [Catalimonadaceae bacterium]|nr:homogentisate 1,2-dioxygenase [Catalimonadaceae bacterium]